MAMRILKTKLFVPPLRQEIVARPQLMARLDGLQQRPLALISAPAGYGKTTLVANWLNEKAVKSSFKTAWLSLEESDNDPVRFLRYVVAAVQTAVPELPDDVTRMLDEHGMVAVDGFLTDLLNALTATSTGSVHAVSHPIILVLDDYHLIQDGDIHEGIAFLLDHVPPNLHVIMTTREDPPLPLARLRGRRQLVEIRQADLAFSEAEAAEFLNDVMGLSLAEEAVAALAARTEGWITGLQMAALSMQGQDDVDAFLAAFTGSHRYVLDYLMEEVWQRQSPEIQHFLLQTAVLDELCAELCDAVLGTRDQRLETGNSPIPSRQSQEILEYLDRTNLFVIPLDEGRQWYRYHHLFAELLQQRLSHSAPERVPVLHALAGKWYEENGSLPEAIEHYLAGEDYDPAATLILQLADEYMMRSENDTLLSWVGALPHDVIGERPLLFVYQAGAYLLAGMSFTTIEDHLKEALDHSEGTASAEVNVLRSLLAIFRADIEESEQLSQNALQLLPEENKFLRSLVVQNLALVKSINHDIESIVAGLLDAAKVCAAAGNVMSQVVCLSHAGEFSIYGGHLNEAKIYYEQAIETAVDSQKRPLPIMGIAKMGLGELHREWNDLDTAAALAEEGLALIQRWGALGGIDGYIWLARVKQAQGDEAGAVAAMEKAAEITARFDASELDDYMVGIFRARLDIEQGQIETAVRWFEESDLHNDDWADTPYHMWEAICLTLIRLTIAQQNYQKALDQINELIPRAEQMKRFGNVIDALVLKAVVYFSNNQRQEAQDALQKALALAEPEQYCRIFIDKGEPIRQLLLTLQQTNQPPNLQTYITQLLAAFESPVSSRQSSIIYPQSSIDPLSERELEVLQLIVAGYTNRQIADQLFVAQSTIKTHINNIYSKLDVSSRSEAITRAQELRLI
jgi:LuxR family maltose regulon positive regulatory protein